uniref:hypothetical protein n=1 Tax=Ndongobacter massiliensis TaxID=1871025 RepID=UPI000931717F|nr:hypothetical protein [Ndongobacter massiliensis]
MRIQSRKINLVGTLIFIIVAGIYTFWPSSEKKVENFAFGQGMIYTGVLEENLFEGEGELVTGLGTYRGGFVQGRFSGSGVFDSIDGWIYSATFVPQKSSEQVMITLPNDEQWGKREDEWMERP